MLLRFGVLATVAGPMQQPASFAAIHGVVQSNFLDIKSCDIFRASCSINGRLSFRFLSAYWFAYTSDSSQISKRLYSWRACDRLSPGMASTRHVWLTKGRASTI